MNREYRNYSPEEVERFLDKVISQVEIMIKDNKEKSIQLQKKDLQIEQLKKALDNTAHLRDKLAQYERMEETLNNAILMAQKTSDQIKSTAHKESEIIIEDAKRNASRIVNESLLKAEKAEDEAEMLKRNINIYKKRLRSIIEGQLAMIDEIETVEF